jgi:anaerobic magnesium-protoporphyrin IX monomethyl ester cyclase
MRAILLFPPAADPAHPPLGIAALAGFLVGKGTDVSLLDLNVRAYNELLSVAFLTRCTEQLQEQMEQLEGRHRLAVQDLAAYNAVAENLPSGAYLIERIDEARKRLRDPAIYLSRRTYASVTSIIRRAMQFISAAHFPASWSAGGFSMSHQATRSTDVLAAIDDRRQNLFIRFFESALPEIVARRPQVVGISLNYYGQMIPAMTLAAMVKKVLPEAFLVVGGGLVCFFERRWEVLAPFRTFVDGWIPFEGEKPLRDLIQTLDRGNNLEEVPGLLRFQQDLPVYHPPGPPPEVSELPPPSFDGLPLNEYLAPEIILPILASRGCYWARCAFCSHGRLYRERFRNRPTADIVDTVGYLSRKYRANCFYFVDEAIPPRVALQFANVVATAGLPYRWFTEARFERYFDAGRLRKLYEGGCRMMIFGLESSVTRVLNLMDKGISPELAAKIINDCATAGIRTFVMFFAGFPTETLAEAESTLQFVEEHRNRISHVASGQFVLEPQSSVFRNPECFGITDVFPYPDNDLKTWYQYRVREGMTLSEAAEFAGAIERRPAVRSPDFYLLSRSHLVFLPLEREPTQSAVQKRPVNLSQPARLIPRRRPGLVPQPLAFNLDAVRQRLNHPSSSEEPIEANPTHYVLCSDREALIEVGSDGISLLKACNGRFSLQDILAAVGEASRETTMRFLRDLESRQFIEWEVQP